MRYQAQILCAFLLLPATAVIHAQSDSLKAATWLEEGRALEKQRIYPEAQIRYRQAANTFGACNAREAQLDALHGLCSSLMRQQKPDSVDLVASEGLALVRQHFAGKHLKNVHFLGLQCEAAAARRQYETVDSLSAMMTDYLRINFPEEKELLAGTYDSWGFALSESGRLTDALQRHQQSAALLDTTDQRQGNLVRLLRNRNLTAQVYRKMNRYDEALSQFRAVANLAARHQIKSQLVSSFYSTAISLYYKGDLEEALSYCTKSADLYLEINGSEQKSHDRVYFLMGLCYLAGGDEAQALLYFQKSLAITQQKYGDEHYDAARAMTAIAQLKAKAHQTGEALQWHQKAVAITERLFPEPDRLKHTIYDGIATFYLEYAEQPDSALFFAQKALDNLKALPDLFPHDETLTGAWSLLSDCYLKLHQPLKALQCAQQSLITCANHFNDGNPVNNPRADEIRDPIGALQGLRAKVLAIVAACQTDPGQKSLLQPTLQLGEQIIMNYFQMMGGSNNSDLEADNLLIRFTKSALDAAVLLHEQQPSANSLHRVFGWAELEKSQRLRLALQNANARAFAHLPDSLLRMEQQLGRHIAYCETMLRNAEDAGLNIEAEQWRNDSLFAARRQREHFIHRLEKDYPVYYNLKYRTEQPLLADLQQQLPPRTLLLELSFNDVEDASVAYLLAIKQQQAVLHARACPSDLREKISRLYALLQSPATVRAPRRAEFAGLCHELYQLFIAPVESQLNGIEHLVICGEGVTQYLPFEVLLAQNEDKPVSELSFLIRRFQISYHYSATLFARDQLPANTTQEKSLIAFAPVFGENELASADFNAKRDTALRAIDEGGHWKPLPYSEKEVETITRLFQDKKPGSAQSLTRSQAGKKALQNALEEGASIVHIASHSFADTKRPRFSGIACYTQDKQPGNDVLSVGEVYNLNAKTNLVVLSSCESGVGKLINGEGMLGLNRAFMYAGVPNVTYSLWKVNDRAGADFMSHYYRAILSGQTYAAALRTAKLKMLENPATATPNLWAGFMGIYHNK